jgi:hypothetical protein
MKLSKVYEACYTDSMRNLHTGNFFHYKSLADEHSAKVYGTSSRPSCEYDVVLNNDGTFYLLASNHKYNFYNSSYKQEELKAKALSKLTVEEKELLGLSD